MAKAKSAKQLAIKIRSLKKQISRIEKQRKRASKKKSSKKKRKR